MASRTIVRKEQETRPEPKDVLDLIDRMMSAGQANK
jgi:hypothetical protein